MAAGATAALANFVWWWVAGLMGLLAGGLGFVGSEVLTRRQRMRQLGEDWAVVTAPWPATDAAQGSGRSVLAALNPTERVVRFNLVRQPCLRALVRWCQDDDGGAVCLVQAGAGEGKTRLLIEAVDELIEADWVCGWLRPGRGQDAVAVAARWQRPVLLLADDAATRVDVAGLLTAAAVEGQQVRVVLAARDFGAWWARLRAGLVREVAMAVPSRPLIVLPPLMGDVRNRQQQFTQAVRAFAAWFEVVAPPVTFADTPAAAPVVLLQAAAAVAVADEAAGRVEVDTVQQRLFDIEGAWWREQAAGAGLDRLGVPILADALVLAVLIGAPSRDEAITLLRHVPGLGRADQLAGEVADWLRELYPQRASAWLDPYLPGRLVEWFAADQIAGRRSLAAAVGAAALDDHAAERALDVLARAAGHTSHGADAFVAVITADPSRLLPIAVSVTTNQAEPARLDRTLAAIVTDVDLPPKVLDAFSRLLTHSTVALAWTAVAVARRQLPTAQTDTDRASALTSLGISLAGVGQVEQALATVQEAVEIYRRLARVRPEVHEPDLARSLNNLANGLAGVGQAEQALATVQEAVEIYRRLARVRPEVHEPDLANSLNNLGTLLADVGQAEQALTTAQEAVKIYRRLARARPEVHEPNLANSLSKLGNRLAGVGQVEQAMTAAEEAVRLYRPWYARRPEAYTDNLTSAVTILRRLRARLGYPPIDPRTSLLPPDERLPDEQVL
jgi:tetratricopeptide (TPR) repeat protein